MRHKEGWWRQCQAVVGELRKEGWWNLCKTVVGFLAFFCVTGALLCCGVVFIVWLIVGLLTGQWEEPDDGLGGLWLLGSLLSIVCLVVILAWILRWLLKTWVGPVLRRFYFTLWCVLPILGFVISCENTLYNQRGFSFWDGFWHKTSAETEARYMHMTNAEKLEELVIGITGGVIGAFVFVVPLIIIAVLAGALDDKKTDE